MGAEWATWPRSLTGLRKVRTPPEQGAPRKRGSPPAADYGKCHRNYTAPPEAG